MIYTRDPYYIKPKLLLLLLNDSLWLLSLQCILHTASELHNLIRETKHILPVLGSQNPIMVLYCL